MLFCLRRSSTDSAGGGVEPSGTGAGAASELVGTRSRGPLAGPDVSSISTSGMSFADALPDGLVPGGIGASRGCR